jgi:hypothetical protein
MHLIRLTICAGCLLLAACANAIVRPAVSPAKPAPDALVVLPGFGYDRDGERAFKSLAPAMAADGFDLYLPTFVSRSGLVESRERLRRFFQENHLERYRRVHVFAFIAGGWTFNPLGEAGTLPNLSTIVLRPEPVSGTGASSCARKAPVPDLGQVRLRRVRRGEDAIGTAHRAGCQGGPGRGNGADVLHQAA